MYKIKQTAKKREIAEMVILTLIFLFTQIALQYLHLINLGMYKGVLGAVQYGISLLLLIRNKKAGRILSVSLMSLALIDITIEVCKRNTSSIPGLFNSVLYLITIILIIHHNNLREKDNRTDFTTGSFNRKGLYIDLDNRIEKNKEFSIIYISLDNFKAINDGFGHAYGDELLRKIIKRVNLRFGQDCTIARLGGAEFVVVVNGENDVKNIADRLLQTISEKFILVVDNNHIDCYANCYAGISRYPIDAEDYESLIKYADIAMSTAMAEFRDIVIKNPDLMISVNVSAKDFANIWFVKKIQKFLSDAQFPAKNLEIEITEYCMVTSMDMTIENINKLREMGIQIALDDFGTGYTSLNYVSRLPIDLLKIDKSLIDDIENDKKRRDFVHAVINMGQLMDCEVISEGVENDSQISCLKDYGCDFIQGFVWGKPLMYEDAKHLVSN